MKNTTIITRLLAILCLILSGVIAIGEKIISAFSAEFSPMVRGMKPIMAILVIAVTIPLMSACGGGGSNLFTPLDERIYSGRECKDQEDINNYCSKGRSHVPPIIGAQLRSSCLHIYRYRYDIAQACKKQKERRENPAVGFKCETNPKCIIEAYSKIESISAAKIQAMINAGGDVNAKGLKGLTPLHVAAFQGDSILISILIEAGADLNAKGPNDATPLHIAAGNGKSNAIPILIAGGADRNATMEARATPLHVAALQGHTNVISALIKLGAYVNAMAVGGKTPLDLAKEKGNADVIKALENAGGKCNSTC